MQWWTFSGGPFRVDLLWWTFSGGPFRVDLLWWTFCVEICRVVVLERSDGERLPPGLAGRVYSEGDLAAPQRKPQRQHR